MAKVDHHIARQPGFLQVSGCGIHTGSVVIRAFTAPQNDMAVLIAGGGENRRIAVFRHGQEMVWSARRANGINGDFNGAVGGVFETDRTRQARCQFSVDLTFRGARTNGTPCNQVGNILRRNQVQVFGGGRHAHFVDIGQELPCQAQALVDVETLVQVRVIDKSLPADGGAWLFKIDAHHDEKVLFKFALDRKQLASVLDGGHGVMDGARPDDD